MGAAAIAALLTQATAFLTAIVPQLIALATAAKVGANATDVATIDAALVGLKSANDTLHAQVQAL